MKFKVDGFEAKIDETGFIRIGGAGLHFDNATEGLKKAVLQALDSNRNQAESRRIRKAIDETTMSNMVWADCTNDLERAEFIESGRAYETGVIAPSIATEVADAFRFRHDKTKAQGKPGEETKDPFIGGIETAEERIRIVRRMDLEQLAEVLKRPGLQLSVATAAENRIRKLKGIEARRQ